MSNTTKKPALTGIALVNRNVRIANKIVATDDAKRFPYAAALYRQAFEAAPENDPVRATILSGLAQIALLEANFPIARTRLYKAYHFAANIAGIGHATTVAILRSLVAVEEGETATMQNAEERSEALRKRARRVYAASINDANRQQLPGLVSLLNADRDYFVSGLYGAPPYVITRALASYQSAERELPEGDSNREHVAARIADATIEAERANLGRDDQ